MTLEAAVWIAIIVNIAAFAFFFGGIKSDIKTLKEKMDKHNNLMERMATVEYSTKSAHDRIDELREDFIKV